MTKEQSQVREFHEAFGCTIRDAPEVPHATDQRLRISLIAEELNELSHAFGARDVTEIGDALADLLYVVLGTAVTCGIDVETVFAEVHRSNMTKLWRKDEVSQMPADCHARFLNTQGERSVVVTRSDGKVIKSPSYEPANIKAIIDAQWKGADVTA